MFSTHLRNQPREPEMTLEALASELLGQGLSDVNIHDFNDDIELKNDHNYGYYIIKGRFKNAPEKVYDLEPTVGYFFDFLLAECNYPKSHLSQFADKEKLVKFIRSVQKLADSDRTDVPLSHVERVECIEAIKGGALLLQDVGDYYQEKYDVLDIKLPVLNYHKADAVQEENMEKVNKIESKQDSWRSEVVRLAVVIAMAGKNTRHARAFSGSC